jgi:ABC-type spermidine/putrescine transport system permease subunit II
VEGVAILLNGLVIAFATLFATVAQGIHAAFGTFRTSQPRKYLPVPSR